MPTSGNARHGGGGEWGKWGVWVCVSVSNLYIQVHISLYRPYALHSLPANNPTTCPVTFIQAAHGVFIARLWFVMPNELNRVQRGLWLSSAISKYRPYNRFKFPPYLPIA